MMSEIKSKSDFYKLFDAGNAYSDADVLVLENLVEKYPYSSILHTLCLKAKQKLDYIDFENQFSFHAISVLNREKLYDFIYLDVNTGVREEKTEVPEKLAENSLSKLEQEYAVELISKQYSLQTPSKKTLPETESKVNESEEKKVASVKKEISKEILQEGKKRTFSDWLVSTQIESPKAKRPLKGAEGLKEFKFEALAKRKAEFYSASVMAKRSLEQKEDVVSETLAEIYKKQGDFDRAIWSYEKLSLLVPEKKHYFASKIKQIQKLKK